MRCYRDRSHAQPDTVEVAKPKLYADYEKIRERQTKRRVLCEEMQSAQFPICLLVNAPIKTRTKSTLQSAMGTLQFVVQSNRRRQKS